MMLFKGLSTRISGRRFKRDDIAWQDSRQSPVFKELKVKCGGKVKPQVLIAHSPGRTPSGTAKRAEEEDRLAQILAFPDEVFGWLLKLLPSWNPVNRTAYWTVIMQTAYLIAFILEQCQDGGLTIVCPG